MTVNGRTAIGLAESCEGAELGGNWEVDTGGKREKAAGWKRGASRHFLVTRLLFFQPRDSRDSPNSLPSIHRCLLSSFSPMAKNGWPGCRPIPRSVSQFNSHLLPPCVSGPAKKMAQLARGSTGRPAATFSAAEPFFAATKWTAAGGRGRTAIQQTMQSTDAFTHQPNANCQPVLTIKSSVAFPHAPQARTCRALNLGKRSKKCHFLLQCKPREMRGS